MAQETFINYRSFRWFWFTLIGLAISCAVYTIDQPIGGRNGATVVGYTYGTISTIGIIWLMFFGLRKRAYASRIGTLQGWLAAHVWIGIGLLFLVPLHAGFSFGINVHTLAYVLMVLTIVSGIWGAANYSLLSARIVSNRGGGKERAQLEQIVLLTSDIDSLSAKKSDQFLKILHTFDFSFKPGFFALCFKSKVPSVNKSRASELMIKVPEVERDDALKLIGLIDQKSDLTKLVLEESRIKAVLKIWLYVHVPVSVGLCGALAIHILSVFFYW